MTNYFSRLARATGLHLGAGATATSPDTATQPTAAHAPLAQPSRKPLAPPHGEEMTLVEPTQAQFDDVSPGTEAVHKDLSQEADDGQLTQKENYADRHFQSPVEARVVSDDASKLRARSADTQRPAVFEESSVELVSQKLAARLAAAQEQTLASGRGPSSSVEARLGQEGRGHESPLAGELPENSTVGRNDFTKSLEPFDKPEEERPGDLALPSGAESAEIHAQADTRRAYLREVVEWITATPDVRQEIASAGATEPVNADLSWGKESQPISTQAKGEAAREVEAQDFSLSIGSISIVIEEPPGQALTHAREQRSERSQGSSASVETSRLTRHYIRSL